MRLIATFLLGFILFFLAGELINRTVKIKLYSILGLILILLSFLTGFWGQTWFNPPLNILLTTLLFGAGSGLVIHHGLARRYIITPQVETAFFARNRAAVNRVLEAIPGMLVWAALTSPFWLSATLPYAVAYFLLIADAYWLFSSIRQAVLIFLAYRKVEWAKRQDWLKKLDQNFPEKWPDYYHLLALPTYREPLEVLKGAVESVLNSNYPKDKIFLVVGFEERVNPKKVHREFLEYLNQVRDKIGAVIVTFHPYGLAGEVPGPGTNRNWMINHSLGEFKRRRVTLGKVILTTLDGDFVIHPNFLAGLTHRYLSLPEDKRLKWSLTGVFFYTNNYWQTPAPMRMIAVGTALWQMAEMYGSDKYQNFSSMSINLATWKDIGGWFPDKTNDDSGFYWKAYYHLRGDYKVIPHFLPIYGDAVLDLNLINTFQNQYLQLKRWAYGAEHIPFVVEQYFKHPEIDFWDKTDKLLFAFWGYARWGALALLVTFGGLLIPFINPNYKESVVAVNLPIVSSWILTLAFLGLFVTIYIHEKTIPPRPAQWSLLKKLWSYLQFLLIPLVLVSISTIPAIDALTTLMLGKRLEFRTTTKARPNPA